MDLLGRLEQRVDPLGEGPRDAPARQRTLTETIRWSYDLLAPLEQEVFTRLAVFPAGCTLESAERVSGAGLDSVDTLVANSLLRRRESAAGIRFVMLETVRRFALDRLEEWDGDETRYD